MLENYTNHNKKENRKGIKMKITNLYKLTITLFTLLIISNSAFAENHNTRVTRLTPEAGGIYDYSPGAFGSIMMIPYDPSFSSKPFAQLQIKNLPSRLNGNDFYAVYMSTPSSGKIRMLSFNTSFEGNHQNTILLPLTDDWFTETVTIEITAERDDGLDHHTAGSAYVLRGEIQ